MREIKEPDWKVLRRVHPLERFFKRVLAEIDRVSRDGATSHHARYLQLFRILQQRDREMARLFDNPRRLHALTTLAQMRSQGLLTEDEISSLSPETRGAIQMLLVQDEAPYGCTVSLFHLHRHRLGIPRPVAVRRRTPGPGFRPSNGIITL
jgi:hypothetical protein